MHDLEWTCFVTILFNATFGMIIIDKYILNFDYENNKHPL